MFAHGPMAWVLWLLGYPDQALTRSHATLTYAQELQHAFSLGRALNDVMTLHRLRGEANAAQEWVEAALTIMTEQGFGQMLGNVTFTRAGRWRRKGGTRRGWLRCARAWRRGGPKGQG